MENPEFRHARNMEHLLGKAASRKQSQLTKEPIKGLQLARSLGAGLPKPMGAHNSTPHSMDARQSYRTNVCLAGFQYCFDLILPCYSAVPHFGVGMFVLCILSWKCITFFLILQGLRDKSLPLVSEKTLRF
jgi:hypothetical protein